MVYVLNYFRKITRLKYTKKSSINRTNPRRERLMKICITATAPSLDAQIDPRFGRCSYLLIVDPETMRFEAVPNTAAGVTGGAGIQAAQTIANKGVKLIITGNVGPKAFQALFAANIEVVTGAFSSVREAVEKYKKGELNAAGAPNVGGHFGMGGKGGLGVWRP
jgi:predicted Fe-Mo cluster-binding NifX family protein